MVIKLFLLLGLAAEYRSHGGCDQQLSIRSLWYSPEN